jgi:hypothetical protein
MIKDIEKLQSNELIYFVMLVLLGMFAIVGIALCTLLPNTREMQRGQTVQATHAGEEIHCKCP